MEQDFDLRDHRYNLALRRLEGVEIENIQVGKAIRRIIFPCNNIQTLSDHWVGSMMQEGGSFIATGP